MAAKTLPPPYGMRAGLVPRRPEDFGGGGAFPEVHVLQYPLSMGLLLGDPDDDTSPGSPSSPPSNVLALAVDAHGCVASDAVVRHGVNADKIVYTSHAGLLPKIAAPDHDADADYLYDEVEATAARTRAALQAIVDARLSAASARRRDADDRQPAFVKYKPSAAALGSGAADERLVRLARAQEDPVLPPRHRRRLVPPRPAGDSPQVTVMHSPPRPVSRQDAEDWKIPPSVPDWKNAQGYCVPLDKRAAAAAGGRRMREQDVRISDGFAGLSEALYVAEQKAREAVETRGKVQAEMMMKWGQIAERRLRDVASAARAEAAAAAASGAGDAAPAPPPADEEEEERTQRDVVREERRRERESERRREASGKKSRVTRDGDRDVGERVALGMASTGAAGAGAGEVGYDERLFNQDAGIGSGFAADDVYSVYSGRLFAAPTALSSTLYGPNNKRGDSGVYGGEDGADEEIERIARTERFKPDRGFSGSAERPAAGKRERPVEFDAPEEGAEADDPFELDLYMTSVKEGKKH
ncbi:unnamed protein product [Urochloa decumbens]|uniref:SKI-interacting protein SKIP SNW domain-containing protein n=1 Tax=Urochloa decumbens TaxID=240449 RepID=A0ABC9E7G7_9POAL